jgi:DNA-binding GntR family transcriptional regulator
MDTRDMPMRVERSAKTLRELALEKMRAAIVSLHFRPGDRLVERDLCEQLGVSRTVVREVLRHLEAEGFIQTHGHRGPVVAKASPEEARQIYEIRAMLEGMAARACAEAATPQTIKRLEKAMEAIRKAYAGKAPLAVLAATTAFYEALFEGGGKAVAWSIVCSLNSRINHLRALTIATRDRDTEGPAQMARIVDAVRQRNGDAAFQACLDHVARASDIAQAILRQAPSAIGAGQGATRPDRRGRRGSVARSRTGS